MLRMIFALPVLLAACLRGDETASAYADAGATYRLMEINSAQFSASATLRFPTEGEVSGEAPCNSYVGSQNAPYPWFELGPVISTKRICSEMSEEKRYLAALKRMTLIEFNGPVLILSNDNGEEMIFQVDRD